MTKNSLARISIPHRKENEPEFQAGAQYSTAFPQRYDRVIEYPAPPELETNWRQLFSLLAVPSVTSSFGAVITTSSAWGVVELDASTSI